MSFHSGDLVKCVDGHLLARGASVMEGGTYEVECVTQFGGVHLVGHKGSWSVGRFVLDTDAMKARQQARSAIMDAYGSPIHDSVCNYTPITMDELQERMKHAGDAAVRALTFLRGRDEERQENLRKLAAQNDTNMPSDEQPKRRLSDIIKGPDDGFDVWCSVKRTAPPAKGSLAEFSEAIKPMHALGMTELMVPPEDIDAFMEKNPLPDDNVFQPSHYARHTIEPITFINANGLGFNRGNAIKYLSRAGLKGGPEKAIEDLEKAARYIAIEIECLSRHRRVSEGEDRTMVWRTTL